MILFGFGQEGQKRDAFYQSKADTAPPHAPTVRLPRNRKEGPGARAGWVGVESRKRGGGVTEDVLVRFKEWYDQLVDCWELSLLYIRNMPF